MGSARPPDDRRAPADEFAVPYYRWALGDARRKVRENFPFLRAVKSGLVMRAVAYFESLAGDERLRAATALVKRSHRRGVELAGDSWGAEDEAIDRGRFLAAVKTQLAPVLGAGAPFSTTHEWRYDTPLGPSRRTSSAPY
jgi:hypothetical protein